MEDNPIIQLSGRRGKRRLWLIVAAVIVVSAFLFGSQILAIYMDALWFSSLGLSSVYWYKFRLGGLLFITFAVVTFLILKVSFAMLRRAFPQITEGGSIRLASVEDLKDFNILPRIYKPAVWVLSAIAALMSGSSMSQEWSQFALYLKSVPAGIADPIFNRDISFYLFTLPVLDLVKTWALTLAVILSIAAGACSLYARYLDQARALSTISSRKRGAAAISLAAALLALTLAAGAYLDRFDLLQQPHEIFTGVSYIDDHVKLPALNMLIIVLLAAALVFVINAFGAKRMRIVAWSAVVVAVVWIMGLFLIPQSVYSFSVRPNLLAKESPYIENNIKLTRFGFGLDRFEERQFTPVASLTIQELQATKVTLDNVRLWDRRVLQSALGQIQEIRNYYEFRVPDVDRYMINGRLRQVMLTAREINVDKLPEQSKNWINQHVVYTHGYGVAMNTVSEFTPEGQPHLVLKDMPVQSDAPELKVTRPEIYFGESTNSHVYVHTKPQGKTAPEFNYPAPDNTDSYSEYQGTAGIAVGGLLRKMAMAFYLGDGASLLFSDYINSDSRLLMRRNVRDRVSQLAPYLLFDNDPYMVIDSTGKLFWIIDGFTYSNSFPYSASYPVGNMNVNYIRNSVKAVVDAYTGAVKLYVFEPDDPLIRAYQSIFPALYSPRSEMPEDLARHVRYPSLFLNTQALAYLQYHMRNPQTFFNHEDLWAFPTIDAVKPGGEPQSMEPYHILLQVPDGNDRPLEFADVLPFTPAGAGRNNMIGWMAARSDGDKYGQTLVFDFPKNVTVNGPAQVRARFNQDPTLSQQMTLWDQKGSKLLRGNLLVIPIADSLLYVEPFFLQAENSPLPELRQVAIAMQDRLETGRTFEEAMSKLYPELGRQSGASVTVSPSAAGPAKPDQQAKNAPAPSQPGKTDTEGLANQARQLLADYERLTSEGKHREAGEKLDQLKQTLQELTRKRGG